MDLVTTNFPKGKRAYFYILVLNGHQYLSGMSLVLIRKQTPKQRL